ncbi:hypothetical protein GCM10011362_27780 [Marinobacter halophilus]|nr:hypothetical protein GCM10011362_27780 [Marinobacter halophilus]
MADCYGFPGSQNYVGNAIGQIPDNASQAEFAGFLFGGSAVIHALHFAAYQ